MVKAITSSNITPTIKQTTKKLLPKVSESVSQKVTSKDLLMFRQYIFAKGLELKTTTEEIKQLFNFDGDEFFNASFEFIYKKLGIPEILKPQVAEIYLPETAGMAYDYTQNIVFKNLNAPKVSKEETYVYIRHELQHFLQNLSILRHKEVGEKAVKLYSEFITAKQLEVIDSRAKNQTIEELRNIGIPEDSINLFVTLKEFLKNNDEIAYANVFKELHTELLSDNKSQLENFRNDVINSMGYIKENTVEENRAKKFFNDFLNMNTKPGVADYMQEDGKIHMGKYLFDIRELEALIAGDVALSDVSFHLEGKKTCYINRLNKCSNEFSEGKKVNKEQSEDIRETAQEVQEKQGLESAKDFADYMFA